MSASGSHVKIPSQNDDAADDDDNDDGLLAADDAAEEVVLEEDDQPMGDDEDGADDAEAAEQVMGEIELQNDSVAHFDKHTDSVFCLAQHPSIPSLIVSGGGDDCAYLFDSSLNDNSSTSPERVLPASYEALPTPGSERKSIAPLEKLDGHTDTVNAVTFTRPSGEYILTAGLDGKLRAWSSSSGVPSYTYLAESSEVQEINWLSPCPSPSHPNAVALGASDGSVWVYTLDVKDLASPLSIIQAFYLHTGSCTAGAWTPDGRLLATVSEDSSFFLYDVWGEAASAGMTSNTSGNGQAIISMTSSDQRFAVDGGLYSLAISPTGAIAAMGGADGQIRIVSLPQSTDHAGFQQKKKPGTTMNNTKKPSGTSTQPGTLLASLSAQTDSIESLSFSPMPLTILASASVDGSIGLFDASHGFALRRLLRDAHDGFAVVQVEFFGSKDSGISGRSTPTSSKLAPTSTSSMSHLLTSAGMDGVVRRWDGRGAAIPTSQQQQEQTNLKSVPPNNNNTFATSTTTSATHSPVSASTSVSVSSQPVTAAGPGTTNTTTTPADRGTGLLGEWKGHRGDGEGGGVLAFIQWCPSHQYQQQHQQQHQPQQQQQQQKHPHQGRKDMGNGYIATAGDDGVVLIFQT